MGYKCIDKFTYLHFAVGIVAFFCKISIHVFIAIHIFFEIVENSKYGMAAIRKYLWFWPGGKKTADSRLNIICDIMSACFGWFSAYALEKNEF